MSSRSCFVGVRNQTWRPIRPGPDQRRVEPVDRHVGGADEVDLVAARPRRRQPQRDLAEPPRDDVGRVEERVDPVRRARACVNGGLSIPSMTTSSWFSASWPPPPPIAGEREVEQARRAASAGRTAPAGSGARCCEQPLAPARVSRIRSPLGLSAPFGPKKRWSLMSAGAKPPTGAPPPSACAAHADGVDLVDEDDALAAPLARRAASPSSARKRTMIASMPMNVCAKPEPGIETNGELKPVAIAFASIVLPGAGRAEEEQAALALAAGALERLARLPERDDAADLLLRLVLAADVVELDAPLRVARLEAADLRDAHDQHRAHEDREVGDEEEEDEDDLHPERRRRDDRRRSSRR